MSDRKAVLKLLAIGGLSAMLISPIGLKAEPTTTINEQVKPEDINQNDILNNKKADNSNKENESPDEKAEAKVDTNNKTKEQDNTQPIIYLSTDGSVTYKNLDEAIANVPTRDDFKDNTTKIYIIGTLNIEHKITIPAGKNITIVAAGDTTSINRAKGYDGTMFLVDGGVLQFSGGKDKDSNKKYILNINGDNSTSSKGRIGIVNHGGYLSLGEDANITSYNNIEGYSAIKATTGTFIMNGSTISGNKGKGIAVDVNGPMAIQGNVNIESSKEDNGNYVELSGEKAGLIVTGPLGEKSIVSVTRNDANKYKKIISLGNGLDYSMTQVLAHIKYIGNETIDENGDIKSEENNDNELLDTKKLMLIAKSQSWNNYNEANIGLMSSEDGYVTYTVVKEGDKAPSYNFDNSEEIQKDKLTYITVSNLDEDVNYQVYLWVKSKDGKNISEPIVVVLNNEDRPKKEIQREPITPNVIDSYVYGLSEPLEFYKNASYAFKVVGAGLSNKTPIKGDTRWIPKFWSMTNKPNPNEMNFRWVITSSKNIDKAEKFNMYVFFQKQTFNGKYWVPKIQGSDMDKFDGCAMYSFKSKKLEENKESSNNINGNPYEIGPVEGGFEGGAIPQSGETVDSFGAKTNDSTNVMAFIIPIIISLGIIGIIIVIIKKRK